MNRQTSHEELHEKFVVFLAVNHHLPRQAAACPESDSLIERLRRRVPGSHLDDELSVPLLPGERQRQVPKLMPDSPSSFSGEDEGPELSDVRHGLERRPAIEYLHANDF